MGQVQTPLQLRANTKPSIRIIDIGNESHNPIHIFSAIKYSLVSVVLIVGGVVQAVTGLLGTTTYMRVVYPLLAVFVGALIGLFAYALFNQPKLRQKELDAKATQEEAEN